MKNKLIVLILFLGVFLINFISVSAVVNFTTSNVLQSNNVNDVFIYDITADSTDYTTWYNDSTKSWWKEANVTNCINGNWDYVEGGVASISNRSCKKEFPLQSYLIITDLGLDIIDKSTSKLWMRFTEGANYALNVTTHNSISALNGKIYQGTGTGLAEFNFVNDVINQTSLGGVANYGGNISTRNSAEVYGANSGTGIINKIVNAIFSKTISTDDYVFVGTGGGVSFINMSIRSVFDDAGGACYAVDIEGNDLIYHDTYNLFRNLSLPVADFTADNSTNLTGIKSIDASPTEIFIGVREGGALVYNSAGFNFTKQYLTSDFGTTAPILWNKLGSAGEVTSSELGSNFAISGSPTYLAGKFDNGIKIDAGTEIITISNTPAQYDLAKGTIEMWVKLDNAVVDGASANGVRAAVFTWYATNWMRLCFDAAGFYWGIKYSGTVISWNEAEAGIDISANTLTHLAFTWDNAGSGVRKVYINGVEVASKTQDWNDADVTSATFNLGLYHALPDNPLNGIIDNFKWYDYAKTDFSDRFSENSSDAKMILAGSTNNITSLVLDNDNATLYAGTNDGSTGAVSKINTSANNLSQNWTTEIVGRNILGLNLIDISTLPWLLIGTTAGASIVDFAVPPTIFSVSHSPSSSAELDPNVTIIVTANISDADLNFDTAILQYKNTTSGWFDVTMVNFTAKGAYTGVNTTFIPNISTQDDYTYRIWANDSGGNSVTGSETTINVSWECTWTATADLGQIAGYKINKWIGNISINNTGDIQHPGSNNCSLNFHLVHNIGDLDTEGNKRIYFNHSINNNWFNYYDVLGICAKENVTIPVNATFLQIIKEESLVMNITEPAGRSNRTQKNTTATLVTSQAGPYLYQKISSSPNSVYLTAGNFSLKSYLRNLMGSSTVNKSNTAYNVSFNWSLPSGLINSSGNLSINFTNISDSSLNYNNVNIGFSNLASMSSGIQTMTLYAQGYNLSGDLIKDADNNTLLTEKINITFLCYSTSDGVYVASCGSLDGDYVAPTTTPVTTSSGGGGGGSSDSTIYGKTELNFELVRGEKQEFEFKVDNKVFDSKKENIKISVSGINSEYIEIIPDEISKIGPDSFENIKVKITAPAYFTKTQYRLIFIIKGMLVSNQSVRTPFSERKVVTLYILEVSRERATEMLETSKQMVYEMNFSEMIVKDVSKLLNEVFESYNETDFQEVRINYEEIKEIYDSAFDSLKIIRDLTKKIERAEKNGVEVIETKKILYVAEVAFKRGDYFLALERLNEAKLTYALEVKGEFNIFHTVKNYPLESLGILMGLSIFSFASSLAVRLNFYKRKFKFLGEEEKLLMELMKAVQRECFEKKHLSMDEYSEAMNQYEKKLGETIESRIRIETKLANLLNIKGTKKALIDERKRLVDLMKELQERYLNKGQIETRVYENTLESYSKRFTEVEEKITFLEVQRIFKPNKLFYKIFKFLRPKK